MITKLSDLADELLVDVEEGDGEDTLAARLKRHIYKYTDCGAWIDITPEGVRLGSIVEGYDGDGTCSYALDYPFEASDYSAAIEAIEKEAEAIWHWANDVHFHCDKCSANYGEDDVGDSISEMDELGFLHADCPKCGETMQGGTDMEVGLDFPDIGQDYRNLKGWSETR